LVKSAKLGYENVPHIFYGGKFALLSFVEAAAVKICVNC
jgi:hypothetical protein